MSKKLIFLILTFVSIARLANGQWTKVWESDSTVITCIEFDETESKLHVGYMTGIHGLFSSSIFKTTDGGYSWFSVTPIPFKSQFLTLSLKGKDTVWAFGGNGSGGIEIAEQTTDGGKTWSSIPILADGFNTSYFNTYSNHLLVSGRRNNYGYLFTSIDYGNTWYEYTNLSQNTGGNTGFSFVDSVNGIRTLISDTVRITTDGGRTWDGMSLFHDSTWQPIAIKGTGTYFIASMYGDNDKILRSDDYGYTWDTVCTFPNWIPLTGVIYGDLCHLYVQSPVREYLNNDSARGVFESTDQGKSWHKIVDFIGNDWFRAYYRSNVLFIGDIRNGSIPQYANSLWRYQLLPNKPTMIVDNVPLFAKQCETRDTMISIAAVNQCDGVKVTIDTIYISGSSAFTLTAKGSKREVIWDTLQVRYSPNSSVYDTGFIHFRFTLKGNTFDTLLTLYGVNTSPHLDITLTPILTSNSVTAGSTAECAVYSSEQVEKRGLNSVTFDLTYDNDLLEASGITSQSGITASFTTAIVTNGIARLPVTLTGSDMTIDINVPLAKVKFKTFLTDTTLSTIELSNVKLNDDDADYKNCTLSATGNNTTFTQASICGDSTIRSFMVTGKLIDILSIRPNPATDELRVEYRMPAGEDAVISIIDASGAVVFAKHVVGLAKECMLNTSTLPSGSYILSIRTDGESASSRFMIAK